jgi:hypothetical protein
LVMQIRQICIGSPNSLEKTKFIMCFVILVRVLICLK